MESMTGDLKQLLESFINDIESKIDVLMANCKQEMNANIWTRDTAHRSGDDRDDIDSMIPFGWDSIFIIYHHIIVRD